MLGVVLILFSIYFWYFNKKIHLRPTLPTQIGTGVISGLMGGFFNMQGPPAVLYFISTTKDKNQYMAMAQIYMLSGNIIMALVRTYNGFMTTTVGIDYLYGIGGGYRHDTRRIYLPPPDQWYFQIRRVYLHRNQRTRDPADGRH